MAGVPAREHHKTIRRCSLMMCSQTMMILCQSKNNHTSNTLMLIINLFRNHKKSKKRDLKRKLKVKKGSRFNNYENIGA